MSDVIERKIFEKRITDKNEKDEEYTFITPNLVMLLSSQMFVDDEILLPVYIRNGGVTMWEMGGKNPKYESSIGTVLSGPNDKLLDAVLFNKAYKVANNKQALMEIKDGYHLYACRVKSRSSLNPTIKMFKLTFIGIAAEESKSIAEFNNGTVQYGRFVISAIYTKYSDFKDSSPACRLIDKLFTVNVMKAYYANGWSASNISGIRNSPDIIEAVKTLVTESAESFQFIEKSDDFLDTIENAITKDNNSRKLSSAIQWFDFTNDTLGIIVVSGLNLSNLDNSIISSKLVKSYTTKISTMLGAYNKELIFFNTDADTLQIALHHDNKYNIPISDNRFCVIRGFRG